MAHAREGNWMPEYFSISKANCHNGIVNVAIDKIKDVVPLIDTKPSISTK
jgi:hypothetical protein